MTIPLWRATVHLIAGALLAIGSWLLLGLLALLWGSAVYSLATRPEGPSYLPFVYVLAVPAGLLALLWCVRQLAGAQRARFRRTLGLRIEAPAVPGWWLIRPWRTASTWRQLAYHLVTLAVGVPASVLVLVPPAARRLARADARLAGVLLGPGRADRLEERVQTLTRSRADVITAADDERRRIERDLHDGTQQRLMSLALNLGMARSTLPEGPALDVVAAAHDEAVAALTELREFVRGLHPAVLDDRGLDAAISGVAARAPIPVGVTVEVEPRCSPTIEAIAYFTVSEALTNVAKHAAASRAEVVLRRSGDRLTVVVTDDGRGGAGVEPGGGLSGLTQRAAAVDGTMTVLSPPAGPTTVTVELPCE